MTSAIPINRPQSLFGRKQIADCPIKVNFRRFIANMAMAVRFPALSIWLIACGWLLHAQNLWAQGNEASYTLHGTVLSMQDSTPVALVNIIDLQTGLGNVSGIDGRFSVTYHAGDTIRFSAVGYVTHFVVGTPNQADQALKVLLQPANYQISPVTIHAFDKDYLRDKFKSPSLVIIKKPTAPPPREVGTTKATPPRGIEIGWDPVLNSLRRQTEEIERWKQKEALLDLVNQKYNRDIVRQYTQLTTDAELDDFMLQCGITPTFVLSHNEYDIAVAIKDYYAYYRTQKHEINVYRP